MNQKPEKILSIGDFVLCLERSPKPYLNSTCFVMTCDYVKLMKQSPELGMFTPCVDGKPVEKPNEEDEKWKTNFVTSKSPKEQKEDPYLKAVREYRVAESHVLFEECKYDPQLRILFVGGWYKIDVSEDYKLHKEITIEELAQEVDLKPTGAFWEKIDE